MNRGRRCRLLCLATVAWWCATFHLRALPALAAIVVVTPKNASYVIDDVDANFGGIIPSSGIRGGLRKAEPLDACQPLANRANRAERAFALITRGNCLFDTKVLNAQLAGYAAAIVFNNEDNDELISMSGRSVWDVSIPAVYISHSDGLLLLTLLSSHPSSLLILLPTLSGSLLPLLAASLLALLTLSVFLTSFLIIARQQRIRRALEDARRAGGGGMGGMGGMGGLGEEGLVVMRALLLPPDKSNGLSLDELKALPEITYSPSMEDFGRACKGDEEEGGRWGEGEDVEAGQEKGGDEGSKGSKEGNEEEGERRRRKGWSRAPETCAICLDDYQSGDRLRLLPCHHEFHAQCVDEWLTTKQALCPICKGNAHVPSAAPADAADACCNSSSSQSSSSGDRSSSQSSSSGDRSITVSASSSSGGGGGGSRSSRNNGGSSSRSSSRSSSSRGIRGVSSSSSNSRSSSRGSSRSVRSSGSSGSSSSNSSAGISIISTTTTSETTTATIPTHRILSSSPRTSTSRQPPTLSPTSLSPSTSASSLLSPPHTPSHQSPSPTVLISFLPHLTWLRHPASSQASAAGLAVPSPTAAEPESSDIRRPFLVPSAPGSAPSSPSVSAADSAAVVVDLARDAVALSMG